MNYSLGYAQEASEIQKLQEKTFKTADIETYHLDVELIMDDEGVLHVKETWDMENSATTFFSRKFVHLMGGVIENLEVRDETGKELDIEFGFLDELGKKGNKGKDEAARKEDNKAGYTEKASGDAEIRIGMATAGAKTFQISYDLKHVVKSDVNGKQFILFNLLDVNQVGLPRKEEDLTIKWKGNKLPANFSVIGFYNKVYVGVYEEPLFTGHTVARVSQDYDKLISALTKSGGAKIELEKENWLGKILQLAIVIVTAMFVIFIINILNRNQRTDYEDVPISVTNKFVEKSRGKDRGGKGLTIEEVVRKIYQDENWECIISALYTLRTNRVNEKSLVSTWMAQLHNKGAIEITTLQGVDSLVFPTDPYPLDGRFSDEILKGMQRLGVYEISITDLADDQIIKRRVLKDYLRDALLHGAKRLQELELIHQVAEKRRTGQKVYQPTLMYHDIFNLIEPIMDEMRLTESLGEYDSKTKQQLLFQQDDQETELYILLGIADVLLKGKTLKNNLDLKILRRISSRIV